MSDRPDQSGKSDRANKSDQSGVKAGPTLRRICEIREIRSFTMLRNTLVYLTCTTKYLLVLQNNWALVMFNTYWLLASRVKL